jgi:hypothetical protein
VRSGSGGGSGGVAGSVAVGPAEVAEAAEAMAGLSNTSLPPAHFAGSSNKPGLWVRVGLGLYRVQGYKGGCWG